MCVEVTFQFPVAYIVVNCTKLGHPKVVAISDIRHQYWKLSSNDPCLNSTSVAEVLIPIGSKKRVEKQVG